MTKMKCCLGEIVEICDYVGKEGPCISGRYYEDEVTGQKFCYAHAGPLTQLVTTPRSHL